VHLSDTQRQGLRRNRRNDLESVERYERIATRVSVLVRLLTATYRLQRSSGSSSHFGAIFNKNQGISVAKTQKKQQSNGISDFIKELWQAAVNMRGSIEPAD